MTNPHMANLLYHHWNYHYYMTSKVLFLYLFQKDVRDTKEAGAAMAEADSYLKYALTMFPSALLPLLDKCGIEADAKAATRYCIQYSIRST